MGLPVSALFISVDTRVLTRCPCICDEFPENRAGPLSRAP